MKKKILITLVFIILVYLIYKIFMVNIYKVKPIEFDKTVIFEDQIEIKETKDIKDKDLLEVEGLLLKNYFSKYEDAPNNSVFKVLKDEKNNILSYYYIVSMKEYIDTISFDSLDLYDESKGDRINSSEVSPGLKNYFIKNNINNDIDLFYHIKDNYYFDSNIFTDSKNIIINFLLNKFVSVTLHDIYRVSLIKGNINGYIVNTGTVREVHLLNNNKQYVIILGGDIANDEFVTDLLETVKFK